MSAPDTTLNAIAAQFWGIETLETRSRDALDFYDIAVWNLKAALEAAYRAGLHAAANDTAA